MNYSQTGNELAYFIQLQSSQCSTAEVYKFTLNIGIASFKLCKLADIINLTYFDCHWKKRIGLFLVPFTKKWWEVSYGKSYENEKKKS